MYIHKSKYCLVIFHPKWYKRDGYFNSISPLPVQIQFFTCFYTRLLELALLKKKKKNETKKSKTFLKFLRKCNF